MTTNYSYNSIGLNTKTVDRNGSSTSISYDALNRITDTSQTGADNQSSLGYKYNYNNPFGPSSEQLYINGSLATQNQYTYGADGQITKKDTSGAGLINSNLKLRYDNAGRLKSVGTGVADSNYFYTNYKYTNDRITKVQTNGAQTDDSGDNANAAYDYYPDGKLKKITYPKLNDNSYLTSEYVYNALGRLTSLTNRKGNAVISQYSYTYDSNGNITSVNDGQTTKTYTYDKLNRLKSIQPQTGSKIVYNYDLRGNRITETKTPKFILNNTSYTYDLENRLKSVAKGPAITSMSYYADGLRAKKDSSSGSTSYQYNTSGQLIAEAKNSSTVTTNYIWGPDRVLEKKDVSGGEYYYLYNGHGDVIQMVDRNGNVVNNYQYDEWGNIETSNEKVSNPFKYAGEVYDDETGLYYLKARYYDPKMGKFLNEDSIEGQVKNPLTLNLYTYCNNSPLIYKDSSGHSNDAVAYWYESMWWLTGIDGPIPVGDIIYIGGGIVILISEGEIVKATIGHAPKESKSRSKTEKQEGEVATPCPAPPNPNNNGNKKGEDKSKGDSKSGNNGNQEAPSKITGYTKHGLNQVIGRDGGKGVSTTALLDTIKNPKKVIEQANGAYKFVSDKAVVVLNAAGKVVTAYAKSSKWWR